MFRFIIGIMAVAGLTISPGHSLAQCTMEWDARFGVPTVGSGSNVAAMVGQQFDDGSGPALYVGGNFYAIDGVVGRGIARYDGERFTGVGHLVAHPSLPIRVEAMTVFDPDGAGTQPPLLIVGGAFASVIGRDGGGVTSSNIAAWDGLNWIALGAGLSEGDASSFTGDIGPGHVSGLTTADFGDGPRLVAVGDFRINGLYRDVAVWDGLSWGPLGFGDLPQIEPTSLTFANAVTVHDDGSGPAVYVGGRFPHVLVDAVGAVPGTASMARFNGTTWSSVGGGLTPPVGLTWDGDGLATFDPDGPGPAAGRLFINTGGRVIAWDGTSYSSPLTVDGQANTFAINTLGVFDDGAGPRLYAGGATPADYGVRLLRLDGLSDFQPVSEVLHWSLGNYVGVFGLAPFNFPSRRGLMVMGIFDGLADLPCGAHIVWDGAAMRSPIEASPGGLARDPLVPNVNSEPPRAKSMVAFDADGAGPALPELYVAGSFTMAGSTRALNVAKLSGSGWQEVGGGIAGPAQHESDAALGLAVGSENGQSRLYAWSQTWLQDPFDPDLFQPRNNVHRLVNGTWETMGPIEGFPSPVSQVVAADLGAGMRVWAITSHPTQIVEWTGSTWSPVGSQPLEFSVLSPTAVSFDDGTGNKLWATIGVVTDGKISTWNGSAWQDASTGLPPNFSPQLVKVGQELRAFHIYGPWDTYRWNGSSWTLLATGPTPIPGANAAGLLGVGDRGEGERMYAYTFASSESLRERYRLWELRNTAWVDLSEVDQGQFVMGWPVCMASLDFAGQQSLFFGGNFQGAGGTASWNSFASGGIARWFCAPPACPADFNNSGTVTVQDIFDYLGAYFSANLRADFNGSGSVTVQDIFDYLSAYFMGCP